jgi:hypothetical protein
MYEYDLLDNPVIDTEDNEQESPDSQNVGVYPDPHFAPVENAFQ